MIFYMIGSGMILGIQLTKVHFYIIMRLLLMSKGVSFKESKNEGAYAERRC